MSQSRHLHAPGQTIELHRHAENQLLLIERGVLAVSTHHGTWVAGPLRAIWVPAGTDHEVIAHGAAAVHTVEFPTSEIAAPQQSPHVVAVSALLRELAIAATEPGRGRNEVERIRAVISDQLERLDTQALILPTARDPRLRDACDLVVRHLDASLTLSRVAASVRTSERALARLFRDEFAMSYVQWRTAVRTYEAMVLLTSGRPVTDVAYACGWSTPSTFISSFERATGQTPGRYAKAGA